MSSERDTYVLKPPTVESRFRLDYRGLLNDAQYDAVCALRGPALVVAGAGSGKTRTLVFRVARLVEHGIEPQRILLLTFTRKAASEMMRRASTLLDNRCERVSGGTFHSFANIVLRRYGGTLGLSNAFTILDRGDSEDVINLLRARAGLDKKERRFPRKGTIAELYSAAVNKSRPLIELIDSEYAHLAEHTAELVELRQAFEAFKAERQLLDYDDLLVKLAELLRQHESARKQLSTRHAYIMVDEYQDTNALQAEIVRLLASSHDNVMAVGDDAQSIYAFRGANFRNIMDFPTLFPGARVITLEENYRSTQPILDVTNSIISRASERYTKNLFTSRAAGAQPLLVATQNENMQSRFLCQRILELREEGVPLPEIAVLFRSSFHSFDLELELARHDIPFVKRGGFKFIETAHVKDALAHLRVLANPRDAVSWHRVLLLLEGVGPRTATDMAAQLGAAVDKAECLERMPVRSANTDLRALAGLFRRIEGIAKPDEQLTEVLRYYEPIVKRVYRDDYPKRLKDLEHFVAIAARYTSLEQLLADMALDPPSDSVNDVMAIDGDDEGLLTLSTIHSAKGLEWHTVFVIWAVDGKLPSMQSLRGTAELEEERRLLYVAATRAKENLYISYPVTTYERGVGLIFTKVSRFLDDVPPALLRPVKVVEEIVPV